MLRANINGVCDIHYIIMNIMPEIVSNPFVRPLPASKQIDGSDRYDTGTK